MTEAEALDLALPLLRRAGLASPALDVLTRRRLDLTDLVFIRQARDANGVASYLVGDPKHPASVTPKSPAGMLMLYTLVDAGMIRAAEFEEEAKQPVDVCRNKIERALFELRLYCEDMYRALYPLDRARDGCFYYAQRPGAPRIITRGI